ncbi:uncharacterized protein LOC144390462 [Gasterosteus aculeatus]
MEEHVQQVRLVLQRLQANQLYVNAEKSLFHVSTLTFLGYVLSPGGVAMDQGKVDAVHNWPTPNTVKELQRFLGFSNYYRRFIRNFGAMAAPLTALTSQKKGKLPWSDAAQKAFDTLKLAFTSAPVLNQPDPDRQFIVEVDASEEGVGGVLSQRTGSPPKVHPCAFFSKKLSPAERNYDVGNRELLAIKLALEEWRHWLEGARHPFMVLTDHRNLEYLKGARRLNPRQARWALFFTRFQFTVSYQPGEKNAKADALSRLYGSPASMGDPEPILPDSYFVGPIHWELESVIQDALRTDPAPPDTPANRVYVPASVRPQLVQWSHTSLGSGHPGITRTTQLLSQKYWWNSLAPDVRDYVLSCPVCAQTKTPRQLPAGELVPLPTPQRPWSHVAVDFLTDLPASEGFTTILVLVDRFSKMCRFIPLCNLPSAIEMAECLFLQVFRPFGLPEEIISDRGPQFTSQVWRAFCNRLGIKVKLTSGYHPETNGQTERLNQELGKYLRGYCLQHPHDWSRYVAWAEYAQNSTFHSSLRLTPFQCVLGYQPPLFPWDTRPGPVPAVEDWFQRSGEVWETAHRHLRQAASTQKKFADRRRRPAPSYQTGQRVWLSTRNLKLRLPCRKLWPRYIGPFKITHRINPVTYRLLLPKHYRISSAFHVSLLKPVHASPLHPSLPTPTPPAPLEIDGGPAYAITAVLDSKRLRDGLHYLVDWEGYGPEKRSWIPARDVLSQELIEEFHRMRPDRPAPRPRGRPPSTVARPSGAGRGGGGSGPDVTEYLTRIQMEPSELQLRLAQQEERVEELCQLLRQSATPAVQPAIPAASTGPAPMAMPGKYDGSPGKCLGFLMQCGMYIAHHSANYQTEKDRVDFVISLLTGRALDWATALWSAGAPELLSEQHFQAQFKEVFDHPITGKTTGDLLCEIRQGSQTVSDYALRFRTLAAGSGWSETALLTIYRRGLRPELQAELACRGDVTQLGDYIRVSISVGHLLESRRPPRAGFPSEPTFPVTPPLADEGPEPMQLGRLPLSPAERIRRIREQLCLYCGEAGHLLRNCRLRPPRQKDGWTYTSAKVGLSPVLNMSRQQLTLPTVLSLGKMKQEVRGLVDSGAAGNFMDQHLAHRLSVPLIPVRPPLRINALDGQPLGTGMIMHQTANITLRVGALHEEDIRFFIVSSPREPLILGHPWLVLHDPVISWRQGELLTWSPECMSRCLNVTCRATSVEAATATKTQAVPPCYETLQEVFSKQKAAELAPHRPCDCAIELLPEGPLPRGRIYALSLPEEEAMNRYVEESLQQGIIRPSTSPAASSFFFVGKKDGGLRPCIDYRALNAITVKNRFPLPLIPAALEQYSKPL